MTLDGKSQGFDVSRVVVDDKDHFWVDGTLYNFDSIREWVELKSPRGPIHNTLGTMWSIYGWLRLVLEYPDNTSLIQDASYYLCRQIQELKDLGYV